MRLDKECSEFKGMDATGKGASTKMMMTYMHTFSDDWWKSIDGGGYAIQHPSPSHMYKPVILSTLAVKSTWTSCRAAPRSTAYSLSGSRLS